MDETTELSQPKPPQATVVQRSPRGAAWWIASGLAGLALLVIGLLGGILIGQHLHAGMAWGHDRPAHIFIQNDGPGFRDRMPDRFPGEPRRDQPRLDHPQSGDQSQDGSR